jgi:hypothetical protein
VWIWALHDARFFARAFRGRLCEVDSGALAATGAGGRFDERGAIVNFKLKIFNLKFEMFFML